MHTHVNIVLIVPAPWGAASAGWLTNMGGRGLEHSSTCSPPALDQSLAALTKTEIEELFGGEP